MLCGTNDTGVTVCLNEDQFVSMNMWGLPTEFLDILEDGFVEFLQNLNDDALKKEYLLPRIIDKLLKEGKASVKVLKT